MRALKSFLFDAVENKSSSFWGRCISGFFSVLITLNVLMVVIETLPILEEYRSLFLFFEFFSVFFFALEYGVRIWTAPLKKGYFGKGGRWRYARSWLMIFDALVFLPALFTFVFPGSFLAFDARILRLLRTFRILRLHRYFNSLSRIFVVIFRHKEDLISIFLLIFTGTVITSTAMYYAEHGAQPEVFASIPDAIYWGVVTLSTIGYGDITPHTGLGKLIAVLVALIGVAVYALPTTLLGAAFYAEMRSKEAIMITRLEKKIRRLEEIISDQKRSLLKGTSRIETKEKRTPFVSWLQKWRTGEKSSTLSVHTTSEKNESGTQK